MVDNLSFWSFGLKTFKAWVTEPVDVKTVSKWMVSAEVCNKASLLVMNNDFLHAPASRIKNIENAGKKYFMFIKNTAQIDVVAALFLSDGICKSRNTKNGTRDRQN